MNFNKVLLNVIFDRMSDEDQDRSLDKMLNRFPFEEAMGMVAEAETLYATKEGLLARVTNVDMTSWITNPDRSGGQFTEQELRDAEHWR
jgi:hypothetical protein